MFDYMYSSHRKEYIQLSFKFWTTPYHVYQLAHGKDVKSEKDHKILHELHEMGIIHRHRNHHHSESSSSSNKSE